jgi:phosphopantothenoylcysteine decarboxylase/phosphopantothenate--cysteine ligase
MDLDMYKHPSTQVNIKTLNSFGYRLIEPQEGELASGLKGVGRLEEPERILALLIEELGSRSVLSGLRAMVSAGPTHEAIDAVRYISNYSSGKMGLAIAQALAARGAEVELVMGPTSLDISHPNIKVHQVTSAAEMYTQCMELFPAMNIGVMAAAVADFRPVHKMEQKLKKDKGPKHLELEPTQDILAELGRQKQKHQVLVGFALETENELAHARQKLKNKNLDLIVLNSLNDPGAGFGYDTNKVTILDNRGNLSEHPLKSKDEVAVDIVQSVTKLLH